MIRKSLVCCLSDCWPNPFFCKATGNPWRLALLSPLWLAWLSKSLFCDLHFLLFWLIFCFLCFVVFELIPFILKQKYFSQKIPLKIYFKNSFRVFRIKIFFLKKVMRNHILIGLHPSRFFNKKFGFEQNTNQSLWSQMNGIILG